MDAQLKAKWVEALRSGEYKQTQFELVGAGPSYCCLGVLCTIEGRSTESYTLSGNYAWANQQVGDDSYGKLIDMNDGDKNSFSEIADYIEANL